MGRLVQNQGARFAAQGVQHAPAPTLPGGQKPLEREAVGRQTADAEQRGHHRWAGDGNDADARFGRGVDQTVARVGNTRGAGVADQRHVLSRVQAVDQLRRLGRFGVVVIARQPRGYVVMREELAGVASVFRGDQIDFPQDAQRSDGDVFQIPDRRGDDVQRAGIRLPRAGVPSRHAAQRPQSRAYRKSRSIVRAETLAMMGSLRLYCESRMRAAIRSTKSAANPRASRASRE